MEELRAKIGKQDSRYAGEPGTGPAGKTCRDCAFLAATGHRPRLHFKCGKTKYTHGDATTIRVRTKACQLFEQFEPKVGLEHS